MSIRYCFHSFIFNDCLVYLSNADRAFRSKGGGNPLAIDFFSLTQLHAPIHGFYPSSSSPAHTKHHLSDIKNAGPSTLTMSGYTYQYGNSHMCGDPSHLGSLSESYV